MAPTEESEMAAGDFHQVSGAGWSVFSMIQRWMAVAEMGDFHGRRVPWDAAVRDVPYY
jgi:hypothetical protein